MEPRRATSVRTLTLVGARMEGVTSSGGRPHHRPTLLGPAAMDTRPDPEPDPRERQEAAQATARLIVLGARERGDDATVQRLVRLTDEHGIDLLAQLWADSPAESLPGALWRLYALRDWVHRDPAAASREYHDGRRAAPVLEVVAGVADPPGPEQVKELVDAVLGGVFAGDFAVALERAAAFARIVAVGRAHADDVPAEAPGGTLSAGRLVRTAEQLEHAATAWRAGTLQAP